jgi:hypothetical protein
VAQKPLTIPIDPTRNLARILPAARTPVAPESDGIRHTIEREGMIAGYKPAGHPASASPRQRRAQRP